LFFFLFKTPARVEQTGRQTDVVASPVMRLIKTAAWRISLISQFSRLLAG